MNVKFHLGQLSDERVNVSHTPKPNNAASTSGTATTYS
jgi:hypothetical protein